MFDKLRQKASPRSKVHYGLGEDEKLKRRSYLQFTLLAAGLGMLCGAVAIGFRFLVEGMTGLFGTGNPGLHTWPVYLLIILIPALGGLCAGLIISRWAPEAKGHGVPEVMEAMALKGGRMRMRVIGAKAMASAVTIGSGGSAGREGPIVHMSSALGSSLGSRLGLTTYHVRILVGCGAAGAISATFNTPLAGIIFAIELILPEIRTRSFIPVVLTSVFANITSWSLLRYLGFGEVFVFGGRGGEALAFHLQHPMELGFYLLLGLAAGLVAILFTRSLYSTEDAFDRLSIPSAAKPAIGGLIVGVVGVVIFHQTGDFRVFGIGYDSIRWVLDFEVGDLAWGLFFTLVALVLLKVLSTSLTLGSGGSGGVFAPSLCMGAMLGGAIGVAVNLIPLPFDVGHPGAYALVGMAAVFAGASRATLTAIIIIFEMTGDYFIIIPLMFACVIADGVAAWGFRESIYTMKLKRRGVRLDMDREADIMEQISVREIMHRKVQTVPPDLPLEKLRDRMMDTGHMGFPVVEPPRVSDGDDGKAKRAKGQRMVGIVTHRDFQKAWEKGRCDATVGDVMTRDVVTITPSMTLEDVLLHTGWRPLNHLPVVDHDRPGELIGFVTKGDILRAYRFRRYSLYEQSTALTRNERRRKRRREDERRRKLRELREIAECAAGPGRGSRESDTAEGAGAGGGKKPATTRRAPGRRGRGGQGRDREV